MVKGKENKIRSMKERLSKRLTEKTSPEKASKSFLQFVNDFDKKFGQDEPLDFSNMYAQGLQAQMISLEDSNLSSTNFRYSSLRGSSLCYTNCQDTNFFSAHLEGTTFIQANLDGADLRGAVASMANFTGATLRGAKLLTATVDRANFTGADLSGADLRGGLQLAESAIFHDTILIGAKGLEDLPIEKRQEAITSEKKMIERIGDIAQGASPKASEEAISNIYNYAINSSNEKLQQAAQSIAHLTTERGIWQQATPATNLTTQHPSTTKETESSTYVSLDIQKQKSVSLLDTKSTDTQPEVPSSASSLSNYEINYTRSRTTTTSSDESTPLLEQHKKHEKPFNRSDFSHGGVAKEPSDHITDKSSDLMEETASNSFFMKKMMELSKSIKDINQNLGKWVTARVKEFENTTDSLFK